MRMYVIERDIPEVDKLNTAEMCTAAGRSNQALRKLAPDIQWNHSYVVEGKTYCVYLAKDEETIRKHAELSGFPANKISEVNRIIDPTTARGE